MKILITGGSGFIGTNLVQSLTEKGNLVINYDINPPRNPSHDSLWVKGDVLDANALASVVKDFNPEYFIHLAARTDLGGKDIQEYSANITGVQNVIDTIQVCQSLERVLFASSRLVCRIGYTPKTDDDYCPTTFYGKSKVMGERIVRENAHKIPSTWAIFRPTSIWGPWFDTPYKEFFLSILHSNYIHPKGHQIWKSFGYVGNSVYIIEKMLVCDSPLIHGKTFYLADYPPLEVKQWADLIATKSHNKHPLEVPLIFLKLIAILGDGLKVVGWKNPPLTSFRLSNLTTEMIYNTSLVEEIGGRLPYSIEDGVDLTLAWLKLQNKMEAA